MSLSAVPDTIRSHVENILIIKLSSLGDVIHALPVPAAFKTVFAGARISFLVDREYSQLLRGNPYIDEVIEFDRKIGRNALRTFRFNFGAVKKLRKKYYDLVVDLQGLLRSGIMARLSRAKEIIGFENAREGSRFLYHRRIPVPDPDIHAVDRYLLIPRAYGWKERPLFTLSVDFKDDQFVDQFIKAEKIKTFLPLIAIHPVARWKTKQWSNQNFARLADMIQKSGNHETVFLGTKEELPEIENIVSLMDTSPHLATGKLSLMQLAAFLKRCSLLVTNDSGPMHLATALNVPVLALFGATDFRKTGPYRNGHRVIRKDTACSPCLNRFCTNAGFPMECMEKITPEEVFERMIQSEREVRTV